MRKIASSMSEGSLPKLCNMSARTCRTPRSVSPCAHDLSAGAKPFSPRDTPDVCADLLNGRHQRIRNEHGPEEAVAKLSADLRISTDSARIVAGSAGHESRPEHSQQSTCAASATLACPGGSDRRFRPPFSRLQWSLGVDWGRAQQVYARARPPRRA